MNLLCRVLCAVALSLPGSAWAAPIAEPLESAEGFRNFELPVAQAGSFELSFDARPLADKIDCFTGIAGADAARGNDVAVIVRFNDGGSIDARNGGAFASDRMLAYAANKTYRVRIVVDMAKKTYSVFVMPAGEPEVALAKDYAFRSGQGSVPSLAKLVLAGFKGPNGFTGPHRVSGITLKPLP